MTRRSFITRQLVIRFPGFLVTSGWKAMVRSASVGRTLSVVAREGARVTGRLAVAGPVGGEVVVRELALRGETPLFAVSVDARARLAGVDL